MRRFPRQVALLGPLLLLGQAPGDPDPVGNMVRRFYPQGPGLTRHGLMVRLTRGAPPRAALLFLDRRGWARLHEMGPRAGGERLMLGPAGAWRCRGNRATPLDDPLTGELRLLRDGLALVALWEVQASKGRLVGRSPLRLQGADGVVTTLEADAHGLPRRLTRTQGNDRVTATVAPNAERSISSNTRWPSRLVVERRENDKSLLLDVTLTMVEGFQAAAGEAFFSPPNTKKTDIKPALPPGVVPGRLDFQNLKASPVLELAAATDPTRREADLVAAGKALAAKKLSLAGLPGFLRKKNKWVIHIPYRGKGSPPAHFRQTRSKGGLHAITFVLGNWDERVLEKAAWLERLAWTKGYRATGHPLLIPYRSPGEKAPPIDSRITEIRLPVAHRR